MLGLTAWVFRGLVDRHPTIALNMLKVVAQRLRNATKADEPS
jgi:CRP-like cAMP-binding protein